MSEYMNMYKCIAILYIVALSLCWQNLFDSQVIVILFFHVRGCHVRGCEVVQCYVYFWWSVWQFTYEGSTSVTPPRPTPPHLRQLRLQKQWWWSEDIAWMLCGHAAVNCWFLKRTKQETRVDILLKTWHSEADKTPLFYFFSNICIFT